VAQLGIAGHLRLFSAIHPLSLPSPTPLASHHG
jgi:hypothetical protein